jgi:hypothetical protein
MADPQADKPNFLVAVKRLSMTVETSWGSAVVSTLCLLDAIRYGQARLKYYDAKMDWEKIESLSGMVDLVSDGHEPELTDLPILLVALSLVNPPLPKVAWLDSPDDRRPKEDIVLEDSTDYEGREVAWFVSILASRFGWSHRDILYDMTYAEACCYVQEALIGEHNDREYEYMLAEVGFVKHGDEYVKEPFPELPWRTKRPVRQVVPVMKVPKKFQPDGVIIDLTNPEAVKNLMGGLSDEQKASP